MADSKKIGVVQECVCGYRRILLDYPLGAYQNLQAYYASTKKHQQCPDCGGDVILKQLKYKEWKKLKVKFPGKKSITERKNDIGG